MFVWRRWRRAREEHERTEETLSKNRKEMVDMAARLVRLESSIGIFRGFQLEDYRQGDHHQQGER